jgi:hypothetical protein
MVRLLPELMPLQDYMEEEANNDVMSALAHYEEFISAMEKYCRCSRCQKRDLDSETECLVVIMGTAVQIARIMGMVDLPVELSPSRYGIYSIYREMFQVRLEKHDINFRTSELPHPTRSSVLFAPHDSYHLRDALRLFCGRSYIKNWNRDTHVALSSGGICAYWSTLGNASKGRLSGRITIIPGQVEWNGRSYEKVFDTYLGSPRDIGEVFDTYLTSPRDIMDRFSSLSFNQVHYVVTEKATGLRLHFEIEDQKQSFGRKVKLNPAYTITKFLESRGYVPCFVPHQNLPTQVESRMIKPGHQLFKLPGLEVEEIETNVSPAIGDVSP